MTRRFDRSIVDSTAHRPWPMPDAPWSMTKSWNDLLFAHWRVDGGQLRRAVPDAFDLDLFDGEAGLAAANHLTIGGESPLLHFAWRQDMLAWAPTRLCT
jgi:hypothetical protein